MKPLKIKNLILGEGIPKICVPIVGTSPEEIEAAALALSDVPADVVEWRADWLNGILDSEGKPDIKKTAEILRNLRSILGETVLLFTFRTFPEGGNLSISPDAYEALNLAVAASGLADLIDVELFTGHGMAEALVKKIQGHGIKTIVSSHDFEKTPDLDTLVNRLERMREIGADIVKIAVMPQSRADVLTLLAATEQFSRTSDCPAVTMSMGSLGAVSRICGETFGSALTFGSAGTASAPGQLEVSELHRCLLLLHKNA